MGDVQRATLGAFDEARRVNEQWIAGFAVAVALIFGGAGLVRLATGDTVNGMVFTLLCVVVAAYYALALWRARTAPPSRLEAGLRTVLETSLATALVLSQAPQGPDQALLNAPVLLWVIAIFVPILRLYPPLSLLAGVVAAGSWLSVWALLVTPAGLATPALEPSGSVERAILLVLCGVLSHRIAAGMVRLTGRVAEEATEREQVRRAFGAYVSEPVVERVLQGDLQLSTERRVITVLFVDIRGFTSFSAGREPAEVLDKLNRALEAFSVEVRDRGGIVNKFLGDGLMALFGAPVEEPLHARQAAEAAVAIARAARLLSESGAYPGLRVGVGLHSGEVVVGDIGGRGHREYTAIGDVVNVASRVEGMTKELQATILVTDAVRAAMGDGFQVGDPVQVTLRGRAEPTPLYPLNAH